MKNIKNMKPIVAAIADGEDNTIIGEPTVDEAIQLKNQLEFVSYKTPHSFALCMGVLRFKLGETEFKFGDNNRFWQSGGACGWDDDETVQGPWDFKWDEAPNWIRAIKPEFENMFNKHVPWGCCGGCV